LPRTVTLPPRTLPTFNVYAVGTLYGYLPPPTWTTLAVTRPMFLASSRAVTTTV
jgi:hypothetical protein